MSESSDIIDFLQQLFEINEFAEVKVPSPQDLVNDPEALIRLQAEWVKYTREK